MTPKKGPFVITTIFMQSLISQKILLIINYGRKCYPKQKSGSSCQKIIQFHKKNEFGSTKVDSFLPKMLYVFSYFFLVGKSICNICQVGGRNAYSPADKFISSLKTALIKFQKCLVEKKKLRKIGTSKIIQDRHNCVFSFSTRFLSNYFFIDLNTNFKKISYLGIDFAIFLYSCTC